MQGFPGQVGPCLSKLRQICLGWSNNFKIAQGCVSFVSCWLRFVRFRPIRAILVQDEPVCASLDEIDPGFSKLVK